jgi:hypothetical protein
VIDFYAIFSYINRNRRSIELYLITSVDDDNACKECGYYARTVHVREYEKHGWNCVITSKKHGKGH